MHILMYLCQKSGCDVTAGPPFHSVLLLLQTTRGREKSGQAVVCSLGRRQSEFQSVSGPGPSRLRGGGRFSVGPVFSIFISESLAPRLSGQVPETGRLYTTETDHTHFPPSWPVIFSFRPLQSLAIGLTLPHPVRDAPHGRQFV
jgi:hypothetical protein